MDNYFRQTFFNLDPASCLSLADHMETHARVLRRHAETLEASQVHGLRQDMKRKKAAKLTSANIKNGQSKRSSILNAAMTFKLPIDLVEANYNQFEKKQTIHDKQKRKAKAFMLSKKGFSLREIAKETGFSHMTVSRLIKGA